MKTSRALKPSRSLQKGFAKASRRRQKCITIAITITTSIFGSITIAITITTSIFGSNVFLQANRCTNIGDDYLVLLCLG